MARKFSLGFGRVVVHFPYGGTNIWHFGVGMEEAGFITHYADAETDGHLARAVRELLNLGVARAFESFAPFEEVMWNEVMGFSPQQIHALLERVDGAIKGAISTITVDEVDTPMENAHAEFDGEKRDRVLLVALSEARRNGRDVAVAMEFLLKLGWAYYPNK